MQDLAGYDGEVRYTVILHPRGGLTGDMLRRCMQVAAQHMEGFTMAGESEEGRAIELRYYDGARRLARLQISDKGLGMRTDSDERGGVSYDTWQEWLGQIATIAEEIDLVPVALAVSALQCEFRIVPPPKNCYEWLLSRLAPESKLRAMAGRGELVDFTIRLKMCSGKKLGKSCFVEIDSNLTEQEIASGDYSDPLNRAIITCHHVITDIGAAEGYDVSYSLSKSLMQQQSELCQWINRDVLPVIRGLQPSLREVGGSAPQ